MNWLTHIKKLHAPSALVATSALASALISITAQAALNSSGTPASAADYTASPPQIVQGSDPFLLINLSVELTQQAEAFTGARRSYADGSICGGRDTSSRDVCYNSSHTYIGYFDPDKCYTYNVIAAGNIVRKQKADGPYRSTDVTFNPHYFTPDGAVNSANSNHECNYAPSVSDQFSGNFMNWATMTALDQFRRAMTGGARIYDDIVGNGSVTAKTLLARTYRYDTWGFVNKVISDSGLQGGNPAAGSTFTTDPRDVTPFNVSTLRVENDFSSGTSGHRVRFYDGSGSQQTLTPSSSIDTFNVIVEVCKDAATKESNCVAYTNGLTTWYKPEGLLQQNSLKMRYALTSYSSKSGNTINGGLLRSNAKYIGQFAPTGGGGYQTNTVAETDAFGRMVDDPEGIAGASPFSYAVNSGIMNYINHFALHAQTYKNNDPAAELYYEGLRYLMGLGPTPTFSSSLTSTEKDGFPVYDEDVGNGTADAWIDPISTANSCQANFALYVGDQFAHEDDYLPGINCSGASSTDECYDVDDSVNPTPVVDLNAVDVTNTVGGFEGLGNIGASSRSGSSRGDGFWIAGLAYWANISDIRPSIPGVQSVKTFIVDTQEYKDSPPMRQDNQLWLAAKYGGFDDLNGDGDPNNGATNKDAANVEWTSEPATNLTPDPDAYTLASDPANLIAGLTNIFNQVLQTSSSASAAAVVSNSSQGIGALYEAIYEPRVSLNGQVATWTGMVRGLWIDSQGRVRDDSGTTSGTLDSNDNVVVYVKNNANGSVTVNLEDTSGNPVQTGISVRSIQGIWNARDQLAIVGNVTTNRTWDDPANTSNPKAETARYIFTWIDEDLDGTVDANEQQAFEASIMSEYSAGAGSVHNARLLGLDSTSAATAADVEALATDLVNYIRGQDNPGRGWRNRTISGFKFRLGDIIHSAPRIVGPPDAGYDLTYGDTSYRTFKNAYANRRQVVYVGANDGMLHAFNAGFFDPANQQFDLAASVGGNITHALGTELWAYVPFNLLPHLQWLTDPSYPHIYYVDGKPQAFDVNIFPASTKHPDGWGTILVVPFRFGGGDITIDPDSDLDATTSDDVTMRSAYVVLDVTDPEVPPTVLAEITHSELGFTTSEPAVIKRRVPVNGSYSGITSNDDWLLVLGSGPIGPSALTSATSNQEAKYFLFNLNTMQMESGMPISTGHTAAFVGDIIGVDWDKNYEDEVLYFGTVATTTTVLPGPITTTAPGGSLYRVDMPTAYSGTSTPVDMFNGSADQPFSAPPYATRDIFGQPWVFAGSGRFFVGSDIVVSDQQSYYGLKEDVTLGTVDTTKTFNKASSTVLENTTGVVVYSDGTIDPAGSVDPTTDTFGQLVQDIRGKDGWYFDFSSTYARHVDRTLQIRQSLIFTDYITTGDSCAPLGSSNLYAINILTGTGSPYSPLGSDPNTLVVNNSVSLGAGEAYLSGVTKGPNGEPIVRYSTALTENSGQSVGLPTTTGARMSWRELPIK